GGNSDGELGDTTMTSRSTPGAVSTDGVLSGKQVAAISAGNSHSLAVTTEGKVIAWGSNWYGQLGDNTTTSNPIPLEVGTGGLLSGKSILTPAGASQHSLALSSD